jgi:hypothetical protein
VATGRNSIRNKARGGNRPGGTQGLGAGRSVATTRALEFEEWWDTPPEAVFKPRQRVSRDGQQRSDGQVRPCNGDPGPAWIRPIRQASSPPGGHAEIKTLSPIASFASCPRHPTVAQSRRPRLSAHACWKYGTSSSQCPSQYLLRAHSTGQRGDTLGFAALQRP